MNKPLLLLFILFISLQSAFGVPAKKGLRTYLQPDGKPLLIQKSGDEFGSHYMTADRIIIIKDTDGYFKYAIPVNDSLIAGPKIASNPEERTESEKQYIGELSQKELLRLAADRRNRDKMMKSLKSVQSTTATFPTTGNVKGLVLLVEFKDVKFSVPQPNTTFTNLLNQPNYQVDGATGSARDYFTDQSGDIFTPQFDVYGPIALPQNMVYYGGNSSGNDVNPQGMVVDACSLASQNFGVNFAQYDQNNDGTVDLVYVIYAGYAESQCDDPNTIWPHKWDLYSAGKSLSLNNKRIIGYACSSELSGGTGVNLDGIGTFCHEFSHCLGLPDLYDTRNLDMLDLNFGMDDWDIMASGSYNNNSKTPAGYSAYERSFLGWLNLIELSSPKSIELNALSQTNTAYAAYSEQNRNEYFVFENRQPDKWDYYLPNHGMLITHIDYLQSSWNNNSVNNTPGHQRVSLVPADNELYTMKNYTYTEYTLYKNSLYGDVYPGTKSNYSFTDNSTPAATLFSGGFLGKPVTNISHKGGIIRFEFMGGTTEIGLTQNNKKIFASDKQIIISGYEGQYISIINIQGDYILRHQQIYEESRFDCEPGIYFVKTETDVTKVSIQ